jgi:hypothetical protein
MPEKRQAISAVMKESGKQGAVFLPVADRTRRPSIKKET